VNPAYRSTRLRQGAEQAVVTTKSPVDLPQVLIRVGTAPSIEDIPAPTPRRSLREVLEFRHPRDL
jgi:hypothetical protein